MKQCPRCHTSYDDEVAACPLDGAALSGTPRQDPLLNRVIKGRYRIIDKLGEGGMGSVYRAEQLSVGRTVVLKILHRHFARDQDFVQRFHQEARLAAALNHPRLTTVFDFDQSEEGSLFIVMEYLVGSLLSEVIRRDGPLPLARALPLAIQIAEAVGAAHRAGVIHRDIKPQNIMVLAPGDAVKLMDFGIARTTDGRDGQLTRAGMMIGTPRYMAPEQIEGQPVSEKTDIYALGVVFYELLSGQTPFSAPTSAAVLAKQLTEAPRLLRSVRADVPPLLEQIVMQALEKEAEFRQDSVADIVRRLRAVVDSAAVAPVAVPTAPATIIAPVTPPPPSAGGETMVAGATILATPPGSAPPAAGPAKRPAWAWLRERRTAVAAAVVVVVVTAGAVWWLARPGVHATSVSVAPPAVKPPDLTPTVSDPPNIASSGEVNVAPPALQPPAKAPAKLPIQTPPRLAATPPPPTVGGGADGAPPARPAVVKNPPSQPPQPALSPAVIRGHIERELQEARLLRTDSEGLGVTVAGVESDGMVRLLGVVRDEEAKRRAVRLVQGVAGVTSVDVRRVNVQSTWMQQQ